MPAGCDPDGAEFVGHVGGHLEADPEAGIARQREPRAAQVEHFLDIAREEDRHLGVVKRDFRRRRNGGRLGRGVIAGDGQNTAPPPHARQVGVLERIARPIDPGAFAVPDAEHAVVLRPRHQVGQLGAEDGGSAEVLVDARQEPDMMLLEDPLAGLEQEVEPAEGRPAVSGDQGRRLEPGLLVGLVLVDRKAHQSLDP